jgi:3-methyladenine DNA glycosylase AlkD
MSDLNSKAARYVSEALAAAANPEKADGMRAYMKTDMPFYGVQKQGRTVILRELVKDLSPSGRDEYEDLVLTLWALPHREEKYIALGVARHFEEFVVPESLPLYRGLIVGGAWWDFVDEVATKLIRSLVLRHPEKVWPVADSWIDDDDMWLRRTAIICQIGLKEATDAGRLFRFCEERMDETEFFIRKAIGWALREYAKTDPNAVARFARAHRDDLSGLSFREATKHIKELVD